MVAVKNSVLEKRGGARNWNPRTGIHRQFDGRVVIKDQENPLHILPGRHFIKRDPYLVIVNLSKIKVASLPAFNEFGRVFHGDRERVEKCFIDWNKVKIFQ